MVSKAFEGIMAGIADAIAYAEGNKSRGRTLVVDVPTVDVREARAKVGLSQDRFAKAFGINVHTLRKWEQGQRQPRGPAKVLLAVIVQEPEAVLRCITIGDEPQEPPGPGASGSKLREKTAKARPTSPRGESDKTAKHQPSAGAHTARRA